MLSCEFIRSKNLEQPKKPNPRFVDRGLKRVTMSGQVKGLAFCSLSLLNHHGADFAIQEEKQKSSTDR
jgi:hypothetical protein